MSRTSKFAIRHVPVALATVGAVLVSTQAFGQALGYALSSGERTSIFEQAAPDREGIDGMSSQLQVSLRRQIVAYSSQEPAGTVIIDTPNTRLLYMLGSGRAISYGIGVGRDGFTWLGVRLIERKAEWPDWTPPQEMLQRQPYLPRFMAGGPTNPLGARAMYLAGTVYRIHGTNAPDTIGTRVSSGCIRMLNDDVIDLYNRVHVGTKVIVLADRPHHDGSAAVSSSARAESRESRMAVRSAIRPFGLY